MSMNKPNKDMNSLAASLNECKLSSTQLSAMEVEHINVAENIPRHQDQVCAAPPVAAVDPKCICCGRLVEEAYYVQCPSVSSHIYCIICCAYSIKQQGVLEDVYCPSGEKCLSAKSQIPWKFSHTEAANIMRKVMLEKILATYRN